jgi:hypothetical protein
MDVSKELVMPATPETQTAHRIVGPHRQPFCRFMPLQRSRQRYVSAKAAVRAVYENNLAPMGLDRGSHDR